MSTKPKFEDYEEKFTEMGITEEAFDAMTAKEQKELVEKADSTAPTPVDAIPSDDGGNTSDNLEGGPDAEDAMGVKKNVVGPVHDQAGPDNSPTTEDVEGDLDKNIEDAKYLGLDNHRLEKGQA